MERRVTLQGRNTKIINPSTEYASTDDVTRASKPGAGQRLEFETDNIRSFIQNRGIKVLWEQAYFCTCLNPDTGHPRLSCPKCHGKGIAYLPPKDTILAIQSQEKGTNNLDLGLLDSGTAIGTTQLEHRVSYRDRFTVPEVLMPQSLVYYVTSKRVKKGIPLYYDVKEVTLIMTQEGQVPDKDYKIENGRLYLDEKYTGHNVSLNILMTLRYVVSDILKESRYQYTMFNQPKPKFENLPQKLLLKREDVIVLPDPYKVEDDYTHDIEMQINDPKAQSNKQNNAPLEGFFGGVFES